MSVAPVPQLPTRRAPALPPHRVQEARAIAAASRWYEACSDPRCYERACCAGKLRRIGDGPRCYPGCLAFALGTLLDPAPAAQDMVALRSMVPAAGAVAVGQEADVAPSVALLVILLLPADEDARDGPPKPSAEGPSTCSPAQVQGRR